MKEEDELLGEEFKEILDSLSYKHRLKLAKYLNKSSKMLGLAIDICKVVEKSETIEEAKAFVRIQMWRALI